MTRRRAVTLAVAWMTAACRARQLGRDKAIVGATLVNPGQPALEQSVVLVRGARVLAAGPRADVTVPEDALRSDGAGKYLIPSPVRIPENARVRRIDTLEQMRTLVAGRWKLIGGVALDTEAMPGELIEQLRANEHVIVPELHRIEDPKKLAAAGGAVRKLAEAGVWIAANGNRTMPREIERLAACGLTPAQILDAVTRGAARAAGVENDTGLIRAGFLGNVWLLARNPLADSANISTQERVMTEGEWGI